MSKISWSESTIRAAVSVSSTRNEILSIIGVSPSSGGNHEKLRRVAKELSIELPSSRPSRVFDGENLLCSQCSEMKPLEDFHKAAARPLGRGAYCKSCSKKYFTTWSDRSPESKLRHAEWKSDKKTEARQKLVDYFKTHGCVDCGTNDPRILVFDHVREEKILGVASLISRGNLWEKIQKEIDKCEVRCYNCHMIVTAERGRWWLSDLVL